MKVNIVRVSRHCARRIPHKHRELICQPDQQLRKKSPTHLFLVVIIMTRPGLKVFVSIYLYTT